MAMVLRSLRQKPVLFVHLNRNLQQFFVSTTASNQQKEDAKVEGKVECDAFPYIGLQLRVFQKMMEKVPEIPRSQKLADALQKFSDENPQLVDQPMSQREVDAFQNLLNIALNDISKEKMPGLYDEFLYGVKNRPCKVGDKIQKGEMVGVVVRKGLFLTILEDESGISTVLRNSEFAKEGTQVLKKRVGWFRNLFGGNRE